MSRSIFTINEDGISPHHAGVHRHFLSMHQMATVEKYKPTYAWLTESDYINGNGVLEEGTAENAQARSKNNAVIPTSIFLRSSNKHAKAFYSRCKA